LRQRSDQRGRAVQRHRPRLPQWQLIRVRDVSQAIAADPTAPSPATRTASGILLQIYTAGRQRHEIVDKVKAMLPPDGENSPAIDVIVQPDRTC
jgi:hypothetical protein